MIEVEQAIQPFGVPKNRFERDAAIIPLHYAGRTRRFFLSGLTLPWPFVSRPFRKYILAPGVSLSQTL
jgi:hypothetical protein